MGLTKVVMMTERRIWDPGVTNGRVDVPVI
jgi:hypothetical protein